MLGFFYLLFEIVAFCGYFYFMKVKIHVRVNPDLENQIKDLAKKNNRTKSNMIEVILYEGVKVLVNKQDKTNYETKNNNSI